MKTRPHVTVFCLLFAIASTATAADGWSLSKLNPFKRDPAKDRARASVSDKSASRVLPKISLPKWGSGSKKKTSHGPSTLTKLNRGTKQFFGKTKSVLMPWSKESPPKPAPLSGSGARKPAKKKSFFTSFFKKEQPEKKAEVTTPTDFLKLDRPGSRTAGAMLASAMRHQNH